MTDHTPTSFAATLAAAKSGESAAFEALYHGLERRVAGFVRARGVADPEGLVNEVFLAVFRNVQSFEGLEPQFNAWVFRIARNKLIDAHRHQERRVDELLVGDTASLPLRSDPHSGAEFTSAEGGIDGYLEGLTSDQREVVVLRIVAGLSLAEVAAVMSRKVGAVKALQHRAFRTIHENLLADRVSL